MSKPTMAATDRELAEAFALFDADKDGQISAAEIRSFFAGIGVGKGDADAEVEAVLRLCDKGEEKLFPNEFIPILCYVILPQSR